MRIGNVIALIPEDTTDEALMSVQSVTLLHGANSARVRCHLSSEFRLFVKVTGDSVTLSADKWPHTVTCSTSAFVCAFKRQVYEIDAAIAAGSYQQEPPKPVLIFDDRPAPPEDFDIPAWDEKTGAWYDAEY
ncbi:hypothetical protein [Halomonas sp. 3A7M]|uniref:hypothetical protein n=1 Tax=Halomonas sp. 3A7M TaxID=2742616 RepID=UPI001867E8FB|nr:hypothetical protein [Halomonas sp. 3A7M]